MDRDDEVLPADECNLLKVSHIVGISSREIDLLHINKNKIKFQTISTNKDILVKSESGDIDLQQQIVESGTNSRIDFELETFGSLIKDEVLSDDNLGCDATCTLSRVGPSSGNTFPLLEHTNQDDDIDIEESQILNKIKQEVDGCQPNSTATNSCYTYNNQTGDSVVTSPLHSPEHFVDDLHSNANPNKNKLSIALKKKASKKSPSPKKSVESARKQKTCVTTGSNKDSKYLYKNHLDTSNTSIPDLPLELIGCLTKRSVHHKQTATLKENNKPISSQNKEKSLKCQKTIQSYADIISSCISQMSSEKVLDDVLIPVNFKKMPSKKRMTIPKPSKVCKQCEASFHTVPALVEHMIAQHPTVHTCDVCGGHFSLKSTLRNHIDSHHKNTQYTCRECGFISSNKSAHYAHRKSHTNCSVFECEYCDYTSQYLSKVRHHQRCHFSQNDLHCPKCDYKTPYEAILKRHLVCHTREKPFKCDECNFSSKFNYNLVLHKRVHSQIKSYKCKVCDKGFKWSCALTAHMLTHTKQKKYFCKECTYSTARASCMRRHQLKHVNSMTCTDCPYTTNVLRVLICHRIRRHKVNNMYVCPFCDFTSRSARKTFQHKSIHMRTSKKIRRESNKK